LVAASLGQEYLTGFFEGYRIIGRHITGGPAHIDFLAVLGNIYGVIGMVLINAPG